jgi:hypothetical protein
MKYRKRKIRGANSVVITFDEETFQNLLNVGSVISDFVPILTGRIKYFGRYDTVSIDYDQMIKLEEMTKDLPQISNRLNFVDYKIYRFVLESLITAPSLTVDQVFVIIKRLYSLLSGQGQYASMEDIEKMSAEFVKATGE